MAFWLILSAEDSPLVPVLVYSIHCGDIRIYTSADHG